MQVEDVQDVEEEVEEVEMQFSPENEDEEEEEEVSEDSVDEEEEEEEEEDEEEEDPGHSDLEPPVGAEEMIIDDTAHCLTEADGAQEETVQEEALEVRLEDIAEDHMEIEDITAAATTNAEVGTNDIPSDDMPDRVNEVWN